MTATTAWAIKSPDGRYIAVRLSELHMNNLMEYLNASRREVAHGYRCVRVRVEEIENQKDKPCNLSDCEVADKSSKECKKCMAA